MNGKSIFCLLSLIIYEVVTFLNRSGKNNVSLMEGKFLGVFVHHEIASVSKLLSD